LYSTISKRVFDIIAIKIYHLKDENKWENSRRLYSSGLDIGGLQLMFQDIIAFLSKRRLIRMSAS